MSEFEVVSYTVEPVEGDDQIEIVINASDGNKWEYGIPFSRSSGRYTFEEIDVLAMDFGEEFGLVFHRFALVLVVESKASSVDVGGSDGKRSRGHLRVTCGRGQRTPLPGKTTRQSGFLNK